MSYDIKTQVESAEEISTLAALLAVVETWWGTCWDGTDGLSGRWSYSCWST